MGKSKKLELMTEAKRQDKASRQILTLLVGLDADELQLLYDVLLSGILLCRIQGGQPPQGAMN